jgi:hypothetical protein
MQFSATPTLAHRAVVVLALLSVPYLFSPAALALSRPPVTFLVQNADGTWTLDGDYGSGCRLVMVDAQRRTRLQLSIEEALPKTDFDKYVRGTPAGSKWWDYALDYFVTIQGRPHFCIRTWWGRRILVDLAEAKQVSDAKVQETLVVAEAKTAMDRLRAGVPFVKAKSFWSSLEAGQTLPAVHYAGWMKLRDAVPLLQELEESDYAGTWRAFPWLDHKAGEIDASCHRVYGFRRLAQLALRRIGAKPAGYAATTIRTQDDAQEKRTAKERYPSRVANAPLVKKDMKPLEVLDKLGPPDYVELWRNDAVAWRYDMDAVPAFSLLVIIDHYRVESVEKWEPALWHANERMPASAEPLVLGADGSVRLLSHAGIDDPSEVEEASAPI